MIDENIIVDNPIEEYDALDILENENAAQIIPETVDVIEVEGVESYTIGTQEAFGALGEPNEQLVHSKLNGRYDANQHPIAAIEGLRDELNSIEALQTVYSDSKGCANYYQWADGGSQDEDRLGRFVTFAQSEDDISITHIKICTDGDVYGVTTTAAAFIGGQADTPRDYRYGLVAHSGIVAVRCEVDIKVGDYVISNQFGYAKKSNSDCGYKVYAIENIHGAYYAVIDLKVPVEKLHKMASNLISLDGRVERVESNIVSAINTANEAYNKADKAGNVSEEAVKKALEALGIATDTDTTVKELGEIVSSSNQLMAEAKALADSAILSADAIRKEAVEVANDALTKTTELRTYFDNKAKEMSDDLDGALRDIESLEEDLIPLATWPPNSENPTGIAGFVAKANEDSSILGAMVGRKGEDGESLAGFLQKATDTYATIEGVASYQRTDEKGNPIGEPGVAGLMAQVDANKATAEVVAKLDSNMAGLQAQVDENTSNVSLVSKRVNKTYIVIPEWVGEEKADTTKIYYDTEEKCYYYYYDSKWKKAININVEALGADKSKIYYVVGLKQYLYYDGMWRNTTDVDTAGLPSAIAGIQVVADDNSSKINLLTSSQDDLGDRVSAIELSSGINPSIQLLVSSIDKYSVGEYSQSYGLSSEQAQTILKKDMVYIPTENHSESNNVVMNFVYDPLYVYDFHFDGVDYSQVSMTVAGAQYYIGNLSLVFADADNTGEAFCILYDSDIEAIILFTATSGNHDFSLSFRKSAMLSSVMNLIDLGSYQCVKDTALSPYCSFEDLTYINSIISRNFSRTRYYTWNGTSWIESGSNGVYFSKDISIGDVEHPYWYTETDKPPTGYEAYALYVWTISEALENGGYWKKVSTLESNTLSRSVSLIRQTANSISLDVTSVKGDVVDLNARIADNETSLQTVTSWKSSVEDDVSAISTIKQTASDNEAAISLVVQKKDGENVVSAGSIVTAINQQTGDSVIKLDATYLDLCGWVIDKTAMQKETTKYLVRFRAPGEDSDGVLAVKDKTSNTWPLLISADGSIKCTKGTIAGWEINSDYLGVTSGVSTSNFFLSRTGIKTWIPAEQNSDTACLLNLGAKFIVTTTGKIYATDACISGGTIGAWSITDTAIGTSQTGGSFYIASASDNIDYWIRAHNAAGGGGDQTFGVKKDGTLEATGAKISGHIEATSGSFSGSVYASGGYFTGTINAGAVISNGVQLGTSSEDVYSMTVGNGSSAQSINIGFENDNTALFNISSAALLLRVINQENGRHIDSLTMYRHSNGIVSYSTVFSAYNGKLSGTWYGTDSISVTSDQNKKNTITSLDDKYGRLFDGLIGRTYKYNDGTSSRLHTGFIAQEVAHAISAANMDSSEFAGLVVKDNFDGTQDWYLRYEEFIALNTWQIQKLKSRVAILEQELKELKSRLEI